MAGAIRTAIRRRCRISSSSPKPLARKGIRCSDPAELDAAIQEMIDYDGPVIFDCVVDKIENCFPMIPSGKAHNDMLLADLSDDAGVEIGSMIDEKGKMLV